MGLPIIGQPLRVIRKSGFTENNRQKYGDIFKTQFLGMKFINLYGKDDNKFVLSNENKYFVNSSFPNSKKIFGINHLTWQRGEKHKQSRKILSQGFNNQAIRSYINTIEKITKLYLEKWSHYDSIDLYPELTNYTFDLTCQILLGVKSASKTELFGLFKNLSSAIVGLPLPIPQTKFGRALQSRKKLLKELDKIIIEHQNKEHNDALDILLQKLFNPERFNNENREDKKQPYTYLPFGGGLRECLGKELAFVVMKIFASILTRNYSWKLLSDFDLNLSNSSSFVPTWEDAKMNLIKFR